MEEAVASVLGDPELELPIVLEFLLLLVSLEQKGMKFLLSRVPPKMDSFVTVYWEGLRIQMGKRVFQVCTGVEWLYQSYEQKHIDVSKPLV